MSRMSRVTPVVLDPILGAPGLAETSWSVEVRIDGRVEADHDPSRLLPSASVGKLFLLIEVARRIGDGRIDPDALVRRDAVSSVADSGLWQHLATEALPVRDLAVLVGAASDNQATNALLDLVGLPAVTALAADLVEGGSRLLDRVRDVRLPGDPETLSLGCAADLAALMVALDAGKAVNRSVSAQVLAWLAPALDLSMVSGAFGLDPLAHTAPDRGVRLWIKTGTDAGVRADVGLVHAPAGRAVYAVLCAWDPAVTDPRDEVLAAMRAIGASIRRRIGSPVH